jgi:hypothetical protein
VFTVGISQDRSLILIEANTGAQWGPFVVESADICTLPIGTVFRSGAPGGPPQPQNGRIYSDILRSLGFSGWVTIPPNVMANYGVPAAPQQQVGAGNSRHAASNPKPRSFDPTWPPRQAQAWLSTIIAWLQRNNGALHLDLQFYLNPGSPEHCWLEHLMSRTLALTPDLYPSEFVQAEFLRHFAPEFSSQEREALDKLLDGKVAQAPTMSVEKYHTEFSTTVRMACPMGEEQQCSLFLRGLLPSIKKWCTVDTFGHQWQHLPALVEYAIGQERRGQTMKRSAPDADSSVQTAKKSRHGGVSLFALSQGGNNNANGRGRGRAPRGGGYGRAPGRGRGAPQGRGYGHMEGQYGQYGGARPRKSSAAALMDIRKGNNECYECGDSKHRKGDPACPGPDRYCKAFYAERDAVQAARVQG